MREPTCPRCGGPLRPSPDGGPPVCTRCMPLHGSDADTKTSAGDPSPPPLPQDYRGRTFGNYEILDEVSRGAMGVVYKARQPLLDRVVALKVLLAGEMASGVQVERFRREAQAAARLRHPAIVPIHDIGVHDGRHYYTMDYIEGRPLSELIAAGELSPRRALEIAADVAEALHYAHSEGVIHRDIKPGNIMVDPDGQVHIMDFGLAKLADSDTQFTRTGTTVGTPSYMPPEQASGESRRVDHRADIYSLGAVLYEMLTGRPPFASDTMVNTLMQVLNDDPVPPKRRNPRIHRDIQTIVLKAMEKRPERRYPSVQAFADDLRRFIGGESIRARPASSAYRAGKWLRKHRTAAFALAAVLVIGLTAFAVIQELRQETVQRVEQARELGKLEGVKDAEARLRQQQEPTRKIVFADDFDRQALGEAWTVENGRWDVADGGLHVAARSLAAVHTRRRFTGNVALTFDLVLPPAEGQGARGDAVLGCFLGSDWRHGYRIALGARGRSRLAIMNPREEVASVECPSLEPERPYRVTVRRTAMGLRVVVEDPNGERRNELAYNELQLPRHLGRDFAAGLFAERTALRVESLRVEQEFLPLKTGPLDAPEELYRVGNYFEARNLYQQIAQGYEGRYEGVAALHGMALCEAAQGRHALALQHVRRAEGRAARVDDPRLPSLLARVRLHQFFARARLNDFAEAVQALRRLAEGEAGVEPAWVWHLPQRLAGMINNRAYGEALELLRAGIFSPGRQTLYGVSTAFQAPALQATVASRVRELAEAFCDDGHHEKVREVYAAYPTPLLGDAFARATEDALRRDQHDEALALLAFGTEHKMTGPRLTQAALELGKSFCDAEQPGRLADLAAAFPAPELAPLFARAIRETTAANRLDEALALLTLAAETYPAKARTLLGADGPAVALGKAFVARGDLRKPIELHRALGQPGAPSAFIALFVEATERAVAEKKGDLALELLAYSRAQLGPTHAALAAAAARLVAQCASDGTFEDVVATHEAYPHEVLAPSLARAMADATTAGRLADALAIFLRYAQSGYELPEDYVPVLAEALAARDPAEPATKALLEQFERVKEAYGTAAARSALSLALGTAYVRAGRLLSALAQYELAGDFDGLLRGGCVAAELGLGDRALALWHDLQRLAEGDADWTTIAGFLLGTAGTADLERAATAARLSPAAIAYLRGLRLWLTDASGYAQEFATAARGEAEWFIPLARRDRATPTEEPPAPEAP